jgi:hypothetical protein
MGLNVETSYSTSNETKNMSMLEPHESHESKPLPQSTSPSNPAEETQHLDLKRSSPVSKTFETTELCEEILSHLSCLELWRARSTCKSFNRSSTTPRYYTKTPFWNLTLVLSTKN